MKVIEKTEKIGINKSFFDSYIFNKHGLSRCEDGILDFLFPDLYKEFVDFSEYDIQLKLTLTPKIKVEDDEPTINIKLREAVKEDKICKHLGLNPWCVAEGTNGDEKVEIPVSLAKEIGLI